MRGRYRERNQRTTMGLARQWISAQEHRDRTVHEAEAAGAKVPGAQGTGVIWSGQEWPAGQAVQPEEPALVA
jgi:hypothetical protein